MCTHRSILLSIRECPLRCAPLFGVKNFLLEIVILAIRSVKAKPSVKRDHNIFAAVFGQLECARPAINNDCNLWESFFHAMFFNLYYFLMTRSSNLLLFAIIIVVAENGVLYQFFSFSNTFKYLWKCIEYLFIKQRIYWSSMAQASISIWDFSSKEKSFSIHRCRWMLLVLFLIFFF